MRTCPLALCVLLVACATAPARAELLVYAASSLAEAFPEVRTAFATAAPAIAVTYVFGGSSTLVTQIANGAQADVFAAADEATMRKLRDAGLAAGEPRLFAANRLAIVVARGNPKGIGGLADLARPGLVVVLAAPGVPVGGYAADALAKAGVAMRASSFEADAKAVVGKVALGEADAGIAYATDVRAAGARVAGVAIPDAENVTAAYPIAVVRGARRPEAAASFVSFVTSTAGREILARHGFASP